jgi:branched-chain amino acid transport system permease protein
VTTVVVLAALLWLVTKTARPRDARHGREPARGRPDGCAPDHIISATFVIGATLAAIAGSAMNYGTVQH